MVGGRKMDDEEDNSDDKEMTEEEFYDMMEQQFDDKKLKFLIGFDAEYPPNKYDIQREDIGGLEKIIDKLDAFNNGINHPKLYEIMGITPPNGFLLHGPPGTGKTMLAKYMAQTLGARFVDLPLNKYESMWVGEAEKKLATHIKNMRSYHQNFHEKVLLFFDEAEEAFKDRAAQGWHAPRVNVLLREMDGLGDNTGIIFGGATNHLKKIDPALLRAGRFDFIIDMPDYDERDLADIYMAIQNKYNRRAPHHNPFHLTRKDAEKLSVMTKYNGFGPSDINEMYRLAAEEKIRQMLKNEDELTVDFKEYNVTRPDMEKVIESYSRYKGQTKRPIGFR